MNGISKLDTCQGGSDTKGSGGFSLHSLSRILIKTGLGRLRTKKKYSQKEAQRSLLKGWSVRQ